MMPKSSMKPGSLIFCCFFLLLFFAGCKQDVSYRDEIYERPSVEIDPQLKAMTPEQSLKSMYIPNGFRIELVASEPLLYEPVTVAWDGNGKMYVAQMMTYMQNIDAVNEQMPS
jgi:hypothetical protein